MITLTTRPNVKMTDCMDGSGWKLGVGPRSNFAHLQIGNVSVAFDDYNDRSYADSNEIAGLVIQQTILHDDPVRLDDNSFTGYASPAEALLHALAADLGYSVEKK